MGMYGKDHEYANSRLHETIVRLGSEPVYVHSVGPGMLVTCHLLKNDDVVNCKIDDLDLRPVPLGYCNYNKVACYLSRIPMRRDWRQGLRRGNFCSLSGYSADRIPYSVVGEAIKGEYPSFDKALIAIGKVKSIAWHRHWAMDNTGRVLYKGGETPVGEIKGGVVELTSRHMYLAEALKESL